MSRYRCHITAKEESKLPEKVRKELTFLRRRLKNAEDLAHYHFCCRCGDEPPKRLSEKFDKYYEKI